jgi:hypothetical protein
VPHRDPASAIIERYDAPGAAFVRHAEIARWLREHGWMVIDEVAASIRSAQSSGSCTPFSLRGFE